MKATKADCAGCTDDVYNHGLGGAKECWSLKSAKMVTRYRLHWWTQPTVPRAFHEVRVPTCYRKPGQFAYYERLPDFVKAEDVVRMRKGAKP